MRFLCKELQFHRHKSWTKFFVLITWRCFFNCLSRCQIRPCTDSLSRYTYTTVVTVKKWPLNENTVSCSEMCSKCKKLSLEPEVLHEIWTIFRGDIAKRISGNLAVESILKFTVFSKLKAERNFNRQGQNVTGPESKHIQLPEPISGRCIRQTWTWIGTLTGLCLAFYCRQPYIILYSQIHLVKQKY